MENIRVHEPRNLRSIALTSNLAPMGSAPEQILHSTDELSFYTTFWDPRRAVNNPAVTLEAALASDDENPPYRLKPLLDLPLTLPEVL